MKAVEQPMALSLPDAGGFVAKASAVLAAAASGEIAPGQAASLIAALGTICKVAEFDDLNARLAELEARDAKR